MNGMAPMQDAFFLDAASKQQGFRYCRLTLPASGIAPRLVWIYLHPFAEEMNKTRRMAAMAARAIAEHGDAVLQIDLLGCGDSSGEFADATWQAWLDDVELAYTYLRRRFPGTPIGVWGMRLGALLAIAACASKMSFERLLLWQPYWNGRLFLNQFFRLQAAAQMLMGEQPKASETPDPRAQSAQGQFLEIAGYCLSPELVRVVDKLDATTMAPKCPVQCLEVMRDPTSGPSAATSTLANAWRAQGISLVAATVPGTQFWMSAEIETCDPLISATVEYVKSIGGAASV